jgi:hypothetical protein
MKITKSQLKQLIKEELQTLLLQETPTNPTLPLRSWDPTFSGSTPEEEYESVKLERQISAWAQTLLKKGSRDGEGNGDDTYPYLFDVDYAQNPESPTGYIVDLLLAPDYYYTQCYRCEWRDIFYRYNSVKEAEAAIKLYNSGIPQHPKVHPRIHRARSHEYAGPNRTAASIKRDY